jgi:Domain of unknown function (DUF4262)
MRTALDADPSTLDEHERKFVANIRKHGWLNTSVPADEEGPGFCYTTGFWLSFKFPELITFSLKSEIAHSTYWHIFRELKSGQTFKVREPTNLIFENLNAVLLEVPERQFPDYLGWNRWFYGGERFGCLQLVWPDADGKFPWHFDMSKDLLNAQPDLTDGDWSGLRRH